jgi:Ca2+-binding EF-hand superfamily protein
VRAQAWEGAFRRFDKNNNNIIDGDEMQQALEQYGYKLSSPLQDLLKRKYGAELFLSIQCLLPIVHAYST